MAADPGEAEGSSNSNSNVQRLFSYVGQQASTWGRLPKIFNKKTKAGKVNKIKKSSEQPSTQHASPDTASGISGISEEEDGCSASTLTLEEEEPRHV